ncbi:hypothetical protein D3C81_1475240 [compost metagenome]
MHGDQRLVRGDHVLAVLDGLHHQIIGLGVAADQFDDDVDFRVVRHFEDVGSDGGAAGFGLRIGTTSGNLRNLDTTPGTAGNLLGVAFEYIEGTATDGTQPADSHFDRFHAETPHHHSNKSRALSPAT